MRPTIAWLSSGQTHRSAPTAKLQTSCAKHFAFARRENEGSPANSRGLTQNFSVLLSAIFSIKRRFLLHFLKKVHKNVGSRTYQSALALLTSRCYACDILRSLRALPLTTGRNAWAWHDSLRSNMYHAFSCALLGSSLCRATLLFV